MMVSVSRGMVSVSNGSNSSLPASGYVLLCPDLEGYFRDYVLPATVARELALCRCDVVLLVL